MGIYYTMKIAWYLRVNAIEITTNYAPTNISTFKAIKNVFFFFFAKSCFDALLIGI